ncbi:MAG: penicillin-binding transpeptidase domain-containing protein [Actinomycetota bacterium]
MKLPRTLPGSRVQPYSRADAPYFRSPGFFIRVGGLGVLVLVALGLLVLRAWSVQILHGKEYTSVATSQSFRTVDLVGPRGAIVDAHGRKLATTTGRIVITADIAALGTIDTTGWHATADGWKELQRFARFSKTPVHTLVLRIKRSVTRSPFAPATVLSHPPEALWSYLAERTKDYPGFSATALPSRAYPQGGFGSEFLGLLGEVDPTMLKEPRYANAKAGEIVGVSGVEAFYDKALNGGFDRARVRVDSMGRVVGPLVHGKTPDLPTLQLTIDSRLQRAAEKAVRDGMQDAIAAGHHPTGGSAVVMDPYTGAILALASDPNYDQVKAATDPKYNASLYTNPQKLLVNRAIAGVYPTGSTFKPIIAEAALASGLITPSTSLLCSGSFDLGGYVFRNVEAGVFESMTLPTALSQSCDTWFYRLGDLIWHHDPADKAMLIQRWARKFGLGTTPPVDLTGAASGFVPTPAWFQRTQKYPWPEGQTVNLSIGQGQLQVSPLQLAVAYSTIVNGGSVVQPHVGKAILHGSVATPLRFKPVRKLHLVDTWAIKQGLYEAAHSGTSAAIFGSFPISVSGKTGTAEAPPYDDHSWYASYAPSNHPKIVVITMIEHGGFGAEAAAPAAKEIYEAYFHIKPGTAG